MICPTTGAAAPLVGVPAALSLAACTALTVTSEAPKAVTGHPLPPYELHQECMHLAPGDRVDYTFDSSEPVAFDIRYHDGKALVIPVAREKSRADAGVFAPPMAQDYCLAWEAGPAGALIGYRIRLRRAGD